jgi:hypothetical protein
MFPGWDNFYFMIGSAAGGLFGLLFVVVTLTAGYDRSTALRGAALYMTPTAVHFGSVLFMSAIALAPGLPVEASAAIVLLVAAVGLANAVRAAVGIRAPQRGVEAHWSDFWMYGVVPTAIYVALAAAALAAAAHLQAAPHALAGAILALLLAAIRNAWDLVTWIAPRAGNSK